MKAALVGVACLAVVCAHLLCAEAATAQVEDRQQVAEAAELDLRVLEAGELQLDAGRRRAHRAHTSHKAHAHLKSHHHKKKKHKSKKSKFVIVANSNKMANWMASPDSIDHAALEEMGRKDDKEDFHKHGHEAKTKQNERKFKHKEKQQNEETEKRREQRMKKHHHEVFQKKLSEADKKNKKKEQQKEEVHVKANQKKEEAQKALIKNAEKKHKATIEAGRKSESKRKADAARAAESRNKKESQTKHEARSKDGKAKEGKRKAEARLKHHHASQCVSKGLRNYRSNVDVCCGITHPGQWTRYGHHMTVQVSTAHCGFTSTPQYFSSTSGTSWHWSATGHAQHYNPTAHGFRVYARTRWGNQHRAQYRLMWCGFGNRRSHELRDQSTTRGVRLCCGKGNQHWQNYHGHMTKAFDLRACQFTRTPEIFTALGGTSSHWVLRGSDAVYSPNQHTFRTYIFGSNVHRARQYQYKLQWCAVGPAAGHCEGPRILNEAGHVVSRGGRACCGVAHPTWRDYSSNGVTMRINTQQCRFSGRVRYFSALRGSSHHWATSGGNHLYSPNAHGFTVYVYGHGWTVRSGHARQYRWQIEWCGIDY